MVQASHLPFIDNVIQQYIGTNALQRLIQVLTPAKSTNETRLQLLQWMVSVQISVKVIYQVLEFILQNYHACDGTRLLVIQASHLPLHITAWFMWILLLNSYFAVLNKVPCRLNSFTSNRHMTTS